MEKRWDEDGNARQRLNQEMDNIRFQESMMDEVIEKAQAKPGFWNRELVIPIPMAAVMIALLIAAPVAGWKHLTSTPAAGYSASEGISRSAAEPKGERFVTLGGLSISESMLNEGWRQR